MNFIKFHQYGKPILVNLDNVTDIHAIDASGKCAIYFTVAQSRIEVDETIEQIQNLINWGEL